MTLFFSIIVRASFSSLSVGPAGFFSIESECEQGRSNLEGVTTYLAHGTKLFARTSGFLARSVTIISFPHCISQN